jgi:hypothetical protein
MKQELMLEKELAAASCSPIWRQAHARVKS